MVSNYHASPTYVLHFAEGLREELKEYRVSVSVLCPGPTHSALFRSTRMDCAQPEHDKRLMSAEMVALITGAG
ncbi:short chain dehydrogenase [compost metagenome]